MPVLAPSEQSWQALSVNMAAASATNIVVRQKMQTYPSGLVKLIRHGVKAQAEWGRRGCERNEGTGRHRFAATPRATLSDGFGNAANQHVIGSSRNGAAYCRDRDSQLPSSHRA